jgi:hypothetical protein
MLPSKRRKAAENAGLVRSAKSPKSPETACFVALGLTGFGIISKFTAILEEIPKES